MGSHLGLIFRAPDGLWLTRQVLLALKQGSGIIHNARQRSHWIDTVRDSSSGIGLRQIQTMFLWYGLRYSSSGIDSGKGQYSRKTTFRAQHGKIIKISRLRDTSAILSTYIFYLVRTDHVPLFIYHMFMKSPRIPKIVHVRLTGAYLALIRVSRSILISATISHYKFNVSCTCMIL